LNTWTLRTIRGTNILEDDHASFRRLVPPLPEGLRRFGIKITKIDTIPLQILFKKATDPKPPSGDKDSPAADSGRPPHRPR
jgi:hypothetical protein